MIEFDLISEIEIVGVADAGIPNKERIILRAHDYCNLQQFILVLASQNVTFGGIMPLDNWSFFFSETLVEPGDWIVIYSGNGTAQTTRMPVSHERAFSLHWAREHVLFSDPSIVPVLYRINAMHFPAPGKRDATLGLPKHQSFPKNPLLSDKPTPTLGHFGGGK